MVPAVAVEGVGAVALPVPPVETVYHNKLLPVAVNANAVAFWQYVTGLVITGATGMGLTVTLIGYPILSHVVDAFRTKSVPVYVPGASGILITGIGLDGNGENGTSEIPEVQSILYSFGESVTAE